MSCQRSEPRWRNCSLWPASETGEVLVPFYFDGEEPEGWQAALAEFNEKTCIRFVKDQQGLRNKVSVRTRSEPKVCGAGVGMAESGLNKVFLAKPWCWGKGKQDNDMVTVLYYCTVLYCTVLKVPSSMNCSTSWASATSRTGETGTSS